jgi:hypothetical protein
VLKVEPLDPKVASQFEAGDFKDDEAERLLERRYVMAQAYEELLIAARDTKLNPGFAERVNTTFYRDADKIGF